MLPALLLVNLGTPTSYKYRDVQRYLHEFLCDPRVIDIPWLYRQFLVKAVIVPKRCHKTASIYKKSWLEDGSPLMHYSQSLLQDMQKALEAKAKVYLAMRYQEPSLDHVLEEISKNGHTSIKILPLFPQYASATTGSIFAKVSKIIANWQVVPSLSFISSFFDHKLFIEAFAARAKEFPLDEYDHILMSFHGLPLRHLQKADRSSTCTKQENCCSNLCLNNKDCYSAQCFGSAFAIASALNLSKERWSVCFQSRLGKEKWLEPYTTDKIATLAKQGAKKILVLCPAFVIDCIETIYEIGVEEKEAFIKHGGERLDLVPALNNHPLWIKAAADLAKI